MSVTSVTAPNAERAVIGAAMVDSSILGWLELDPADFFEPRHRALWEAMGRLYASETAIDTVTLETALSTRGHLDAVGGVAYVSELAVEVPTTANAEHYARQVIEAREARQVLLAISSVTQRVTDGELSHDAALDAAIEALSQVQKRGKLESTSVADHAKDLVTRILTEAEINASGGSATAHLPTGIRSIELPIGVPSLVAARPGEGKSTFLLQCALQAVKEGKLAVIYTFEDLTEKWERRILARASGVANRQIQRSSLGPKELSAVTQAGNQMAKLKDLHIVHAHGWTARQVCRSARGFARRGDLGLVAVDYAQLVKPHVRGIKQHDAIAADAVEFGALAGKENISVLVASQLLKNVEYEQRQPRLGDLRYGEGLAMAAKLAVLLHCPNPKNEELIQLLIPKENNSQRNRLVRCRFDRPGMRMEELV